MGETGKYSDAKDILEKRSTALGARPEGESDMPSAVVNTIEFSQASGSADIMPIASHMTYNEIQECLSSIWSVVLRNEHIGADDDFLQLGGNSLLAIQIVSRAWDELGIEIPLVMFFSDVVTVRIISVYIFAEISGKVLSP